MNDQLRELAQQIVDRAGPAQDVIQRNLRKLDPWYKKLWRRIRGK